MGVSGSGKSHIGGLLSQALGFRFIEGDAYHTKSNIEKMTSGIPLTDSDRLPWLESLHNVITENISDGVVVACSALKASYRSVLVREICPEDYQWIHLSGDFDLIFQRLQQREGHFMPASLLRSQFEILEIPYECMQISIEEPPEQMVKRIEKEIYG